MKDAEGQLVNASETEVPDRLVPALAARLTLPEAPVAVFPHESRAWTTIGRAEVAMGTGVVAEDPPTGSVEKVNCDAEPGPVTPKALLVPARTVGEAPVGVPVAVMV